MRTTVKLLLGFAVLSLAIPLPAQVVWKEINLGPGGDYCAIALDPSGRPHFSYLDTSNPSNYVLRHTFFDGGSWRREIVDSGDVGWWSSIAVDSNGRPHIAYHADKPSPSLKYAYFDGTIWHTTIVDDGGYSTAMTLDADDNPHIAYIGTAAGTEVRYARFDGANWNIETIFGNASYFGGTSIALGHSGEVHITFSDTSLPRKLYWITNAPGYWLDTYLDEGRQGSLAIDSTGLPRVVYVAESVNAVKYARYNGNTWASDRIHEGDSPSLKLDSQNRAHISFVSDGKYTLGYARIDGYLWDVWHLAGIGFETPSAIALDRFGLPHLAVRRINSAGGNRLAYFQLLLPDLTGSWSQIARTPVVGGESVTGSFEVKNDGNRTAGGVNVRLYLSNDEFFDYSDQLLGKPIGAGKIGSGKTKTLSIRHTSATPVAGKYLVAVIDLYDQIYEILEANNVVSGPIP